MRYNYEEKRREEKRREEKRKKAKVFLAIPIICGLLLQNVSIYATTADICEEELLKNKYQNYILEQENLIKETELECTLQESANLKYNEILDICNSKKNIQEYSDTYGGAYIDGDNNLIVCINDDKKNDVPNDLLEAVCEKNVETRIVQYSYQELMNLF